MFGSGAHQSSLRLMSQKFASMDELFEALSHSAFRSKFRLSYADRTYAETRNDELLKKHAKEILHDRIGSANPKNDGKQTPYKGHPIFTAQHATGCCCRGTNGRRTQYPERCDLGVDSSRLTKTDSEEKSTQRRDFGSFRPRLSFLF